MNRQAEGEDSRMDQRAEGSCRSGPVKIYYGEITSLLDEENFNRNLALVNERRRKKVLNCRQPMDRCRALGAGLLLRQGLLRAGFPYEKIAFEEEERGRLFLPEYPGLSFNLSHSGNYAVAAFGWRNLAAGSAGDHAVEGVGGYAVSGITGDYAIAGAAGGQDVAVSARDYEIPEFGRERLGEERIGVDIECLAGRFSGRRRKNAGALGALSDGHGPEETDSRRNLNTVRRIANRISTDREKSYLESVKEETYISEFTRLWTRKEAWAKAVGLGLSMDFAKVNVLGEDFAVSRRVDEDYWISVCRADKDGNVQKIHEVVWEKVVL